MPVPRTSATRRAMSRKADPSSRRPARRKALQASPQAPVTTPQKTILMSENALDSDFGLTLALCPALRRRPDA